MKELFDAYFLEDTTARTEYDDFTVSVEKHFVLLNSLAVDAAEKAAIDELHANYKQFVVETPKLFDQFQNANTAEVKRCLLYTSESVTAITISSPDNLSAFFRPL